MIVSLHCVNGVLSSCLPVPSGNVSGMIVVGVLL